MRNNNNKNDFSKRHRHCLFCTQKKAGETVIINYKDTALLKRFIGESGKIASRRFTGTCSTHQRALSSAIKLSRFVALLPHLDKHRPDYND